MFLALTLPLGIWAVMALGDPDAAEKRSDKAAFKSVSTTALQGDDLRAEARWERVTTFAGSGPADKSFGIVRRAIQWKANWRCQTGKLKLSVGRASQDAKTVENTSCPDAGEEVLVGHGRGRVQVGAAGPWRVAISQQVDTPLNEPPLAGMTDAALVSRGRVRRIQKRGEGTVSLYRLANGRLALRYEKFYTAPSPGLELWLSEAKNPRSTLDARRADHVNIGRLRSTYGSYNQVLPRDVSADSFDSIVIWCPDVLIAFSAAALK